MNSNPLNNIIDAVDKFNRENDALTQWRAQAKQQLPALVWPSRKLENWRYSSLTGIEEDRFLPAPSATTQASLQGFDLVLEDGQVLVSDELNSIPGLKISSLASVESIKAGQIAKRAAHQPFAVLNQSSCNNGLLISVQDNQVIDKPIRILMRQTASAQGMNSHRLCLDLGANSALSIHETLQDEASNGLHNTVVENSLGDNAQLSWLRNHSSSSHAGIHGFHLSQAANSRFTFYPIIVAGELTRHDVRCYLDAAGAELNIHGVFLASNYREEKGGHSDLQVCVEHCAPNCTSFQDIKGLAAHKGKAVFNGRIHIHKGASKTQADLSNKNLLFSNQASINSKPELEIYNDDVKCSHGTTVGQLDESAVFYLRSRGISQQEARQLLARGFIAQVLAHAGLTDDEDGLVEELLNKLDFTQAEQNV